MREKFLYNEFVDLIETNEVQAIKYKSKFIPHHLYKYQPIGSGRMRKREFKQLRKKRFGRLG